MSFVLHQAGVLKVNQSFIFDVRDLKNAQISVHVVARGVLGIEEALGHITSLSVLDLLEEHGDQKDVEAKWYDLLSKSGSRIMPGKLFMQIIVGKAEPEQPLSAFVGTWNVGNARPPPDLSPWLPVDDTYEIIAIGTQECDYQARPPFTDCAKDWIHTLKTHFGQRYKLVHATSRGQMRLVIFVRDDAEKAISEVKSDSEATGVGNVLANKGGVCISFKFWDTGLCFVNCHFAAHAGQCEARNSNYRQIAGQMRLGIEGMDMLNQFHHVFWLGDLNYRLDFGALDEKPLIPDRAFWATIVKQIHANRWKDLVKYDELRKEKADLHVLTGFKEGEITFPPTFKMQRDFLDHYDQKRMPAWCDRVLWKTLQGCQSSLISYFSAPSIQTSDHKPVGATFKLISYALPSSNSEVPDEDDKR
jgi:phosphatidylinositol-3,4,5-trisphosphate 5-phosphatase 2